MNQKNRNKALVALDVGERRIGVAVADGAVPIARAIGAIDVDGSELERIMQMAREQDAETIVIGYPRNQSGESTAQTALIEAFKERLERVADATVLYQDESLTSVIAEEQLRLSKKPYTKGDIDARAAALILQDYLENSL